MATTNETLAEVLAKLEGFEAFIADVDGDLTELKDEIAKLTAEHPDSELVAKIADKVAFIGDKLKATAERVPEVEPEPEPVV